MMAWEAIALPLGDARVRMNSSTLVATDAYPSGQFRRVSLPGPGVRERVTRWMRILLIPTPCMRMDGLKSPLRF